MICVNVKHEFVSVHNDSSHVSQPRIKLMAMKAIRKPTATQSSRLPIISTLLESIETKIEKAVGKAD